MHMHTITNVSALFQQHWVHVREEVRILCEEDVHGQLGISLADIEACMAVGCTGNLKQINACHVVGPRSGKRYLVPGCNQANNEKRHRKHGAMMEFDATDLPFRLIAVPVVRCDDAK